MGVERMLLASMVALAAWAQDGGCATPAKVVLDTEMETDRDDAAALGALHALADTGEREILATASSALNPWSPIPRRVELVRSRAKAWICMGGASVGDPARDDWNPSPKGRMDLREDMTFDWKPDPAGTQAYLPKRVVDGRSNDRYVEETLNLLLIHPPRAGAR